MADISHKNITDADLHEPKGVAGASAGQVYVANGSGSGTWTAQDRTGLVLLSEHYYASPSSSTADFTVGSPTGTVLDGTYSQYEIKMTDLGSTSSDDYLFLRVGTGGGPTWQSSNYNWSSNSVPIATGDSGIQLANRWAGAGNGLAAAATYEGTVQFAHPDVAKYNFFKFNYIYQAANSTVQGSGLFPYGYWATATAHTGIRLALQSGQFIAGTRISLYGYKKIT